jgi:two-component system nitrogen regulation response regulator NtrX
MSEDVQEETSGTRSDAVHVLVVEDRDTEREQLLKMLTRVGYLTRGAKSGEEALAGLAEAPPDVVLLDLDLGPGAHGREVIGEIKRLTPGTEVIVLSATGTKEDIFHVGREHAFAYLEKPAGSSLLGVLSLAAKHALLRRKSRALELGVGPDAIVGRSEVLRRTLDTAERAAASSATVLLTGENGTGKDLIARFIHIRSRRATRPFVKLNCAAIPKDLVESELFGHERGAFTGALQSKKGKFELADSGSLFLDEIGDLETSAQAKLLRAIENGEIERVGGQRVQEVDVRLIAATNQDLRAGIKDGRFREDLFHRINVVPVHVPPLRERLEDIPLLAEHFLTRVAADEGLPRKELSAAALQLLAQYAWPGNVRELRNLMERATVLLERPQIDASDLEPWLEPESGVGTATEGGAGAGGDGGLRGELEMREAEAIRRELESARWNVTQAAARLGLDRTNLHRKMRKYGIRRYDEEGT